MLERRGIISGYEGSKPRQVLITEADVPRILVAPERGDRARSGRSSEPRRELVRNRCADYPEPAADADPDPADPRAADREHSSASNARRRLRNPEIRGVCSGLCRCFPAAQRRLPDMADIGSTLREARMRARIDISEVEAGTKIRAKYLRALENEEWDLLPGPVYVKSFLKTYGDFLGLDSRLLVDEFKRRYERPSEHEVRAMATTARERDRASQPAVERRCWLLSPRSVIGLALVVIVVALYVIGTVIARRQQRYAADQHGRRRAAITTKQHKHTATDSSTSTTRPRERPRHRRRRQGHARAGADGHGLDLCREPGRQAAVPGRHLQRRARRSHRRARRAAGHAWATHDVTTTVDGKAYTLSGQLRDRAEDHADRALRRCRHRRPARQ